MKSNRKFLAITLVAMLFVALLAPSFALAEIDDSKWVDNPDFPGQIGLAAYGEEQHYTIARDTGLNPVHKPGLDWDNNMWQEEYKKLNIYLDTMWTAEGYEAYSEKLNLHISRQELPDVFACNVAQFQMLCEAELIQPLDDVLEKYAADFFKESLQDPAAQNALKQCMYDGKLMAIPLSNAGNGGAHLMFIRQDWLDNLGVEAPTNMDELEALMYAFTYDDPDQNGEDDTYGLCLGSEVVTTYMSINGIANGFGAFPESWILKDGKVAYGSIQPEMRNALEKMADWYQKGIIDPEFIVKDNFAASMDMVAGKGGVVFSEWWLATWPLPDAYQQGHEWRAHAIPFDVDSPEAGVRVSDKLNQFLVVSKTVEDPSIAVKLSNIYQERIMGYTSDLTVWKGDGEYDFSQYTYGGSLVGPDKNLQIMHVATQAIDTGDESVLETAEQVQVYGYIKAYLSGHPTYEENPQEFGTNQLFHNINYGEETSAYGIMNQYALKNQVKPDVFRGTLNQELETKLGSIASRADETFLNIICGQEPIEAFDAFIDVFNTQGGPEITEAAQAWYDAMN